MVYSFDIFDTLITRITYCPTGLFLIIERILNEDCRFRDIPQYVKENFSHIRINAEIEARRTAAHNDQEEVNIEEIYDALVYMNGVPISYKYELIELEIDIEYKYCTPICENIQRLKKYNREDDVYLISDMYLSEKVIRRMLTKIDKVFEELPIIVSCDKGKTKRTGSLFREFISTYKVDINQWIHIGDNKISDGIMVDQNGGRSCLYDKKTHNSIETMLMQRNDLESQFVAGVLNRISDGDENIDREVGKYIAAPILYGYMSWCIKIAIEKGITDLVFVARDGYIPKLVADRIIKNWDVKINTQYLYGSRRAWRLPAVCSNFEDFKTWFIDKFEFINVNEFAERLNIRKEEVAKRLPHFLVQIKMLTKREMIIVKSIILNSDMFSEIFQVQKDNEQSVKEYFKQELKCDSTKVGFVEINGSGYTQQCLAKLWDRHNPITSFFFSMADIEKDNFEGNIFYKYAYDRLKCGDIVEVLTRAPHSQTIGYSFDKKENRWIPVLDGKKDYMDLDRFDEYINGIVAFTELASKYDICDANKMANVSLAVIDMVCKCPEKKYANYIGDIPFSFYNGEQLTYAPHFSSKILKQIYYHQDKLFLDTIVQKSNLEFCKLRLTQIDKYRIGFYKTLANIVSPIRTKLKGRNSRYFMLAGKIVIYGAGNVGKTVYCDIKKNKNCRIVLWADRNYQNYIYQGYDVSAPEEIRKIEFDYVLICVANPKIMYSIREELIELGIPNEKIL